MRVLLHGRLKVLWCSPAPLSFFSCGDVPYSVRCCKSPSHPNRPIRVPRQYASHVNPTCAVRRYVSLLLKPPIRRCILLGCSCFPSIHTGIALLFNLHWISLHLKEPETLQSTLTHTASSCKHVSGIALEPEYANQCQDFDARSFLCGEDEPALALHRSSVASRTCDCSNSWS